MTSKRVGLVTVAQLDSDLPWVLGLMAYCDALLVVAKSPALGLQFADQLAVARERSRVNSEAASRRCTIEFIQADLARTEGQGRLTDIIRQRGPLYCALNLCGHAPGGRHTATAVTSDTGRVSSAPADILKSTFVDAAMDAVLASVRRDIDATLLLSQAALAGMKQTGRGVLLPVWIEGPISPHLAPLKDAASQFVERFSIGLHEQLTDRYPNIKIRYLRWAMHPAAGTKTAARVSSTAPEAWLSEIFDADLLARQ